MDPFFHTFISVAVIAIAYYTGRWTGGNSGYRSGFLDGSYKGADHILNILEEEGTYDRKSVEESIERWTKGKLSTIGENEV